MIRHFCDICGAETETPKKVHAVHPCGVLTVELTRAVQGTWNGGDVCLGCLLEAVQIGRVQDEGKRMLRPSGVA